MLAIFGQDEIYPQPVGGGEERRVQRTLISAIRDLETEPAPGAGPASAGPGSGSGQGSSPGAGDAASVATLPAAPASIRLVPLQGFGPRSEDPPAPPPAAAPASAASSRAGAEGAAPGGDACAGAAAQGPSSGVASTELEANPNPNPAGIFGGLPDLRCQPEPPGPQPRPPPLPPTAHLLGAGGVMCGGPGADLPSLSLPLPLPELIPLPDASSSGPGAHGAPLPLPVPLPDTPGCTGFSGADLAAPARMPLALQARGRAFRTLVQHTGSTSLCR